eukprot:SAG11_NODE_2547_length_3231_cov_113.952107_2_plen_603_part_00
MCTQNIRIALLHVKNGQATEEVTTTTADIMTMKARITFDVDELPERYTVDTPHEEIREFLGRMYSELKTISNVEIISPEPTAEDEEDEEEEPAAEPGDLEQKLREVIWEGVTYYTYTHPMVTTDGSGSGYGAIVIFPDSHCAHVVAELHDCPPNISDIHWIDQNAYDVHKTRANQSDPENNHVGLRDVRYNNENPFLIAEDEEPADDEDNPGHWVCLQNPPTEYSGWDVFYMHITDLGRSHIWKSVGTDPTDVMRIIDGELDKFKEFKGLGYHPVRADFLDDETNRTDFGLMIDTINQKLTEYSRIPKPHEPGVRRLDDELLAILIDAVNKIADDFRARPGMKPPHAVDILRYFLDARRRAAEPEEPPIEETDTEEIGRGGLCPFTVIRDHDFQEYLLDIYSTKVYEKGTSEGSVGKEVGIFIAETGTPELDCDGVAGREDFKFGTDSDPESSDDDDEPAAEPTKDWSFVDELENKQGSITELEESGVFTGDETSDLFVNWLDERGLDSDSYMELLDARESDNYEEYKNILIRITDEQYQEYLDGLTKWVKPMSQSEWHRSLTGAAGELSSALLALLHRQFQHMSSIIKGEDEPATEPEDGA